MLAAKIFRLQLNPSTKSNISFDSEENNIEMPQFRLFWSPYVELTEDDLMDKDLQNILTQLFRPNEQDLT